MTDFQTQINLRHQNHFFVNGEWRKADGARPLDLVSPVTEQVFASVPEADEAVMKSAVDAARNAFDNGIWPQFTPHERAKYIKRLAEELRKRSDDLSLAWTEQIGAPINYAKAMTPPLVDFFDYYASFAETYPWVEKKPTVHKGHTGLLVREPAGVVAAIIPWNGPFFTLTIKVAPALIAGCTVIIKPSPETPLEAQIFAECTEVVGFPPGVVNVVPADREMSECLIRQPGIDKVSITGSTAAGKQVASICADRVARVTLELGGKSAALILKDYDVKKAAEILASSSCRMTGQVCSNLTRFLVRENKHDEFVEALAKEMRAIKLGDPRDDETIMGPLAMSRQLERVENYVSIGLEEGADLVVGGKRPDGFEKGYYFEPTLFANVDNNSRLAREEIFGPVVAVIPYRSLDHAIEMANDSDFGLNGAVFTDDAKLAYQVARQIRTGTVGHNGSKSDFTIGFGGFKQSGIGREGGIVAIEPYVEEKTVVLEGDFDVQALGGI